MGVSRPGARQRAQSAYRDGLKRFGQCVVKLELSIAARGHWGASMLAGEHVFATMMTAMWGHASVQLRHIDLSGQRQIRGPALEQLLGPRGIPTLEVLSLKGCSSVTGSVPLSIANSKQLHSLNLHGCQHHGTHHNLFLFVF